MTQSNTVAIFVTCVVDQFYPEIGVAAVRLLRRAGYRVVFPAAQTCCGQPFFNSGFQAEAVQLAQRTIEALEPYEAVVVPGGSCAGMIRIEYPHLLLDQPSWRERAEAVAAKTFELTEFLVHEARWQPQPSAAAPSVTYHDSCHMHRLLKLGPEPRQLLAAAGCQISEMPQSDRCCGFGGVFSLHMPEVSNAMTAQKLRLATSSEASLLVTSDPGCLLQLQGLVDQSTLPVTHLAVLLEEMTRTAVPEPT